MAKGFLYDEGDALITRKEDVGGLPDTEEASAGDVLTLDEDKEPVWSTPSGGGGGMFISAASEGTDLGGDVTGYLLDKELSDIVDAIENGIIPSISFYPNDASEPTLSVFLFANIQTMGDDTVVSTNLMFKGDSCDGNIGEFNGHTYIVITYK